MVQKLVILSGLFMSATCMVLHQAPLVYLPVQYQEPTPNYNYAYEVNDAHTGDFKRLQETRIGGAVLGQYSLLQPDGVTRTVDYRADDINGFNAVVNNAGRPNVQAERQEGNGNEAAARRPEERQSHPEQSYQPSNDQQATPSPSTISHTSLIHHVLRNY